MVGNNRLHIKRIASTQLFATNLLSNSRPPDGTVITTDFQEEGMGQSGRGWYSSANQNLLLSIIHYPEELLVSNAFKYSMAISLSLADTVDHFLPDTRASIKWPNDIYIKDQKIAGTLLQSKINNKLIQYLIIGIGLNVNETSFPKHLPNPISMAQLSGRWLVKESVYDYLVEQINHYFNLLKRNSIKYIEKAYHQNLYGLDQDKSFFTMEKGKFQGKIKGVDDHGALLMEVEGDTLTFRQTELSYLVSKR